MFIHYDGSIKSLRPRGNSWALEAGPDPKGAGADNGIPCGAAASSGTQLTYL